MKSKVLAFQSSQRTPPHSAFIPFRFQSDRITIRAVVGFSTRIFHDARARLAPINSHPRQPVRRQSPSFHHRIINFNPPVSGLSPCRQIISSHGQPAHQILPPTRPKRPPSQQSPASYSSEPLLRLRRIPSGTSAQSSESDNPDGRWTHHRDSVRSILHSIHHLNSVVAPSLSPSPVSKACIDDHPKRMRARDRGTACDGLSAVPSLMHRSHRSALTRL